MNKKDEYCMNFSEKLSQEVCSEFPESLCRLTAREHSGEVQLGSVFTNFQRTSDECLLAANLSQTQNKHSANVHELKLFPGWPPTLMTM